VLRYPQQVLEGRFRILSPVTNFQSRTVMFREQTGELSVTGADAVYRIPPEQVPEGKQFVVTGKTIKPKSDLDLLLRSFKETGDLDRLAAAEIPLKE